MSFLAHSQRQFDSVPEQHTISQLPSHSAPPPRMPANLSPFDPILPHNSQSVLSNGSQSIDHASDALLKVGQTRCYWALLSSELDFLYMDPVLQSHLDAQADLLVGKSLLDFVHPDEQASAKQDLGSVLESRTLHGSVTRVRYSRLSRVRRELGYQGPPPAWSDAEKISVDSNYMAVDIVINWAAEGLVLCFIHAVVDINPADDNNEERKTGWTNWCGTPNMSSRQAQLLYRRLQEHVPAPGDMGRVFQILLNQPERPLWMSWPPDPPQGSAEGRATSRDFADLAEEVQIGNNANASEAKTSCTRRYKALQTICMGPEGNKEVESIFIPHGSIIFACHKVDLSPYSRSAPRNGNSIGYTNSSYVSQSQPFYEASSHTYGLPPLTTGSGYGYLPQSPASQNVVAHFSPHEQWPQGTANNNPGHYGNEWSNASVSPSTSNMRSGMYVPPQNNQHQWPSHPPSYNLESQSGQQRSMSPYNYSQPAGDANVSDGGSASGEVPPPRSAQRRGASRDQYGTGGRSTGKPPVGISRCSSCKVTQSPEWRKGPSGKKDLCNACGLRYARSRAKKEGVTSSRRRKDKLFSLNAKQDVQQHSTHAGSSGSGARRASYNEESFLGPLSGTPNSESYSSRTVDTPSPPPTRGSMNFVHYSHQNQPQDQHSPIESRASQFNYPIASSMLDPASLQHQSPPRGNVTSLPRLAPVSFSANRVPPSTSTSPLSAGPPTHASSFERDSSGLTSRQKDRVKREREHAHSPVNLPSTPMSSSSEWSRKSTSFVS